MKSEKNIVSFSDIDAEKELIALICNHPTYLKEVSKIIKPETFSHEVTKDAYIACTELFSQRGTFNLSEVFLKLKMKNSGNYSWVSILDCNTSRNPLNGNELVYYLAELKGKRQLAELSRQINKDLINGEDYFKLLDKISASVSTDIMPTDDNDIFDMKSALLQAVNNLGDVMTNGSLSGVPTGYPKLDEITGGWLKGNVILFAARPGQGKTITLLEHSRCAAEMGNNVLFLSLEMPVMSLIYRMISGQLDDPIAYSKIKTGRISIEQFTSVQREAITKLEKLPITWYDGANRDINYLSNVIQKIVREKNIKMVVIDYLQLMTDNTINASNEMAMVGSVADKIQALSKKLNVPFVCAAQLNRQSESRGSHRPKLSDLRSSGKIEQMASVVIGLYRNDYYAYEEARENNNPNVEFDNKLEYIFLKNRDGNTATLDMFIDVATSRISEDDIFSKRRSF